VITPFFVKPSQEELYEHYRSICSSVSVPVLAYNNPERTGVALSTDTIVRLANEIPNFKGIKDSSGDLTIAAELIRLCPPDFKVIMGRDTLIYGALAYGAAGAVAATANVVPGLTVAIYEAVRTGDHARARELQRRLAPLRVAFSIGTFPVVVKEAMAMMGIIPWGGCRKPVLPLDKDRREKLAKILKELEVI